VRVVGLQGTMQVAIYVVMTKITIGF
jgi:hypothetical protein